MFKANICSLLSSRDVCRSKMPYDEHKGVLRCWRNPGIPIIRITFPKSTWQTLLPSGAFSAGVKARGVETAKLTSAHFSYHYGCNHIHIFQDYTHMDRHGAKNTVLGFGIVKWVLWWAHALDKCPPWLTSNLPPLLCIHFVLQLSDEHLLKKKISCKTMLSNWGESKPFNPADVGSVCEWRQHAMSRFKSKMVLMQRTLGLYGNLKINFFFKKGEQI